jgi:hypothetical protein
MPELIATIILFSSLLGMGIVFARKIPVLINLPESGLQPNKSEPLISKIKEKIKILPGINSFDHEIFLQKQLSRIRVLTLKTENKVSCWLENLRARTNSKNNHNIRQDNYWEELKRAKKEK